MSTRHTGVARGRASASEVAAHWGLPSRKRRRRRAARKVSGWAKGGVPASLGAAAALCLPSPPAVGLARHSSLGRRACPCLGWRSRATGQRSLGSPLCAPRRQPGGFPLCSPWIPPPTHISAGGCHVSGRRREGGGFGLTIRAAIRERIYRNDMNTNLGTNDSTRPPHSPRNSRLH